MDRQVSSSVSELDLEKVAPVLHGRLTGLPPISSRLVRIFVSSTFSGEYYLSISSLHSTCSDVQPYSDI